ncbi:MAG TPA: T9SS type A sorting domain-containing protein [Ohtaekwangia sp.]
MKIHVLIVLLFANLALYAQTIESFEQPVPLRSAHVQVMKTQPDGKILIGGDIAYHGNIPVSNLIRVNPDGSLDETFNFYHDPEFIVLDVEQTNAGDLYVLIREYGSFNTVFYFDSYILKVNAQGSIQKEISAAPETKCIALQDDGKLLAGTWGSGKLVRYHADLTVDTGFENAVTFNGALGDILFVNQKILISGSFTTVNGLTRNAIARLHPDGSIDNSFDPGTGSSDYIGALTVQPDGKILLGWTYINTFNGNNYRGIVRLNENGSVDSGFQGPNLNGGISRLLVTEQGIYAGAFWNPPGITQPGAGVLFRMDFTGAYDTGFEPVVLDLLTAIDAQIAISGDHIYSSYTQDSGNIFGISRIDHSGDIDDLFKPEISRYGTIRYGDELSGKLLVAGDFIRFNGIETYGVARLNEDGTVDESFRLKNNKGVVAQIDVLEDETVMVTTQENFFKLDGQGDMVPEFHWEKFENLFNVSKFKMLNQNKIMVADPNQVNRLHADGSKDASFNRGEVCCSISTAFDFDTQDDKVVYGSVFSSLGGISVNRLARLTSTGLVDTTFNPGSGPNDAVYMIKVLDNNEILVGGAFTEFDGETIPRGLVKLSADGELDLEFNENQKLSSFGPFSGAYIYSQVEQLGTKVYIRGVEKVYVVNTDGTIDEDFNIPISVGEISDLIAQKKNTNGREKAGNDYLFALGSFQASGTNKPSFILKLKVQGGGNENPILSTEKTGHELNVKVFPQPVADILKLHLPGEAGIFKAHIFDSAGKIFLSTSITANQSGLPAEIDMKNAAPGLYLLHITSEKTGRSAFTKFIKTN